MPPGGKQVMLAQNHQDGVKPGHRLVRQTAEQRRQNKADQRMATKKGYIQKQVQQPAPRIPVVFAIAFGICLVVFTILLYISGLIGLSSGVSYRSFGMTCVFALVPPGALLYSYQNNTEYWHKMIGEMYKKYGHLAQAAAGEGGGMAPPVRRGGRR